MKKNSIKAAILFTLLGLCGQGYAQKQIKVNHKLGETTVNINPKKVVIFDIGSLETYHELDIPVAGVTNNVPEYIAEYRSDRYAKLGSIKGPNIQAIKDFAPDLIIISGRQGGAYDSLSMIAPTLFLGVDTKNYWDSFEKNVKTIAQLHGKEKLAEEKLAVLRRKRDLVKEKSKNDANKGLVVMHVRGGYTAYGPGSRFGFPHDVLGIKSTIELNDETHTGHRFKEGDGLIAKANPDYIFLIDRDSATGGKSKATEELLSPELKKTKAYSNGKIVTLPGNIWYISGGGLISVDSKITDIGQQLYGISF